ncbi:MAG: S41 family peptidase [Fibrobacteres bacterium]|nr:S41 family peptidase [Fibrobacterota bacterium]
MDKMRRNTLLALMGAILIVFVGGFSAEKIFGGQDTYYEDMFRFKEIISKIKTNYVEDVPVESLIVYGVDGMRDILDPNTDYLQPKENEKIMDHMKGEFGGLGIHIGMPENQLTVISPMPIPNSPAMKAGLMSGDRIIKIEGKTTKGMEMDDAVSKLRGPKGTIVKITISRDEVAEPFDVELERDIIKVKSVNYYGILDQKNKIGYLNLVSFTKVTTEEIRAALTDLIAQGAKSFILDLRGNGGGLLSEAVNVAGCFLPKDKLVVYTQGRTVASRINFASDGNVAANLNLPMVVLVNGGSASASEIVAGAIQDHDRGVIMGNETFGKGSVQSIIPLDNGRGLKLTTAFYYTPSGRCINKLRNDVVSKRHSVDIEDGVEGVVAADSIKAKEAKKTPYKTLGIGRTVYGSGGVNPDVDVVPERLSPVEIDLMRKSLLFKFASSEAAKLKAKDPSFKAINYQVTDAVYDAFMEYLKKKDSVLETPEMRAFKEAKKIILKGRQDLTDTSKLVASPNDNSIDKTLAELEGLMAKEREFAFVRYRELIKNRLQIAFLSLEPEQDPYYRFVLKDDKYVTDAIKLLSDKKRYDKILSADFKKEESVSK